MAKTKLANLKGMDDDILLDPDQRVWEYDGEGNFVSKTNNHRLRCFKITYFDAREQATDHPIIINKMFEDEDQLNKFIKAKNKTKNITIVSSIEAFPKREN